MLNKYLRLPKEAYHLVVCSFLFGALLGATIGFLARPYLVGENITASSEQPGKGVLALSGDEEFSEFDGESIVDAEGSVEREEKICVDVSGAVMVPGVYCMEKGDMVVNAILKAGDINYDAYAFQYVSKYINYARKIRANEKIYIPFAQEYSCVAKKFNFAQDLPMDDDLVHTDYSSGSSTDISSGGNIPVGGDTTPTNGGEQCINLNSATNMQLESLPGIGPALATRIIEARPFTSIQQLLEVSGIGESKYNQIKDLVCVD